MVRHPAAKSLISQLNYALILLGLVSWGGVSSGQGAPAKLPAELKEIEDLLNQRDQKQMLEGIQKAGKLGAKSKPLEHHMLDLLARGVPTRVAKELLILVGSFKDPSSSKVLGLYLRHRDVELRKAACHSLGQTGGSIAENGLILALSDSHRDVREQAAFALGDLGTSKALPRLFQLVHKGDSSAAKAIGQLCTRRTCQQLVREGTHLPLSALQPGFEQVFFRTRDPLSEREQKRVINEFRRSKIKYTWSYLNDLHKRWPKKASLGVKLHIEEELREWLKQQPPPTPATHSLGPGQQPPPNLNRLKLRMKRHHFWLAMVGWLMVVGCQTGQTKIGSLFADKAQRKRKKATVELAKALARIPIDRNANTALGVTTNDLYGISLTGGSSWHVEHQNDARPTIVGHLVVGYGKGEVFCLQASTGKELWKLKVGQLHFVGAGDDGRTTVLVFRTYNSITSMLAIDRSGRVIRQLETSKIIGQPAVVANIAFFPWDSKYVTAYDLTSGKEIARIEVKHPTSMAFTHGGNLYFGEQTFQRFDEAWQTSPATTQNTTISPPLSWVSETPGWSFYPKPASTISSGPDDKIRLYASLTDKSEALNLADKHYYVSYYRILLGFSTDSQQLSWVHSHAKDILGAVAFRGGIALCDSDGNLTFLEERTGLVSQTLSFKQKIESCVLSSDGFSRANSQRENEALTDQVTTALLVQLPEIIGIQHFLIEQLKTNSSALSTYTLIQLASNPHIPTYLHQHIRLALAARRTGKKYLLDALKNPYDYLENRTPAPPVGPIAQALMTMDTPQLSPLLLRHINDPATELEDLKQLAEVLFYVVRPEDLTELESFFQIYRCTATVPLLQDTVVEIARSILKVSTTSGKQLISFAAQDPLTQPLLRPRLIALLKQPKVSHTQIIPVPKTVVSPKRAKPRRSTNTAPLR
jgi:outer membrane protein assembly factor BamB